jgi:hypothetical protein
MDNKILVISNTILIVLILATLCLISAIGMSLFVKFNDDFTAAPLVAPAAPTDVATIPSIHQQSPITNDCNYSLAPGETKYVNKNCCIMGDVVIDGVPQFDSLQETGHLVILQKDVDVLAPYGASVVKCTDIETLKLGFKTGCGRPEGCSEC